MANTTKGKQAARRERVAALRAQQKRAERRRNLITIGAIAAVAAVVIGAVAWYAASRGSGGSATAEVIPPGVGGGAPTVQAPAHQVPDTSGIPASPGTSPPAGRRQAPTGPPPRRWPTTTSTGR